LYALARDSQLQSRLRKEVTESIDEFSGQWDLRNVEFSNTLDSLPLLHGLCNEVQRLWPSVPNTSRIAYRDTTIVGQTVPKGTKVFIPIWTINRLEQFWGDDAQQFRPERWINAENGKPNNHGGCNNNFGFMTYLHGPRSCIGQGLARAELKALVAAWLYCFEFEFADPNFEAEAAGIVTVKPKGGLKLRMKVLKSFSK
jgi:cytochrome P450